MPKETFHNLDDTKKQRIMDASIKEFAYHSYSEVMLSRIINAAKIPRGSFYQYFEDKKDLYMYIFTKIAEEKIKYMSNILLNPENKSFLDLFRALYKSGLSFAINNPDYIRISKHLMVNRGEIYDELVGDNLDIAKDYYINWIETDKTLGRVRQDVDSKLLAEILIDTTTNIAYDEMNTGIEINPDNMLARLENLLKILQKGIE